MCAFKIHDFHCNSRNVVDSLMQCILSSDVYLCTSNNVSLFCKIESHVWTFNIWSIVWCDSLFQTIRMYISDTSQVCSHSIIDSSSLQWLFSWWIKSELFRYWSSFWIRSFLIFQNFHKILRYHLSTFWWLLSDHWCL